MGLLKRKRRVKGLRRVLGDVELPSFPAAILEALDMLRRDEASLSKVAQKLCFDPGVSSRLLRTANSAAHALRRPVKTVPQAATMLGRASLESLLLSVGVRQSLPRASVAGFDIRSFWHHASRRASVARSLAKRMQPAQADTSCTAALLQDMAIPVLVKAHQDRYGVILQQARQDGADLVALEREAFAWDHPQVAGWICDEWGFPGHLKSAITQHHYDVDSQSAPPAVKLAALLPESDDAPVDRLVEEANARYGLPADECARLVEDGLLDSVELERALQG
jgi:HD-like signal output (HDOD) protein